MENNSSKFLQEALTSHPQWMEKGGLFGGMNEDHTGAELFAGYVYEKKRSNGNILPTDIKIINTNDFLKYVEDRELKDKKDYNRVYQKVKEMVDNGHMTNEILVDFAKVFDDLKIGEDEKLIGTRYEEALSSAYKTNPTTTAQTSEPASDMTISPLVMGQTKRPSQIKGTEGEPSSGQKTSTEGISLAPPEESPAEKTPEEQYGFIPSQRQSTGLEKMEPKQPRGAGLPTQNREQAERANSLEQEGPAFDKTSTFKGSEIPQHPALKLNLPPKSERRIIGIHVPGEAPTRKLQPKKGISRVQDRPSGEPKQEQTAQPQQQQQQIQQLQPRPQIPPQTADRGGAKKPGKSFAGKLAKGAIYTTAGAGIAGLGGALFSAGDQSVLTMIHLFF